MAGLLNDVLDYLANQDGEVSGGQGYCKLPNGTLIQWGNVTVPQGAYAATWNCPVPFKDKNDLGVSLTPLATVTSFNANYSGSTTTQINVGRAPNTSATTMYIIAIGRWK